MDAGAIISSWKQRLTALANQPEYVFRDTPQDLIAQHYRRLTTFIGYSEEEVARAEIRLSIHFPAVFRKYLLEMAKSPGELFRGSNLAGIADFERFRVDALELMADTDPALTLPPEAVVFLSHQGYTFTYLLAFGEFDSIPLQWTGTHREPRTVADTFAEMIDAELQLMESNNRIFREQGGYYLTLHPEGGTTQSHPALASGDRPLAHASESKPWWVFWR